MPHIPQLNRAKAYLESTLAGSKDGSVIYPFCFGVGKEKIYFDIRRSFRLGTIADRCSIYGDIYFPCSQDQQEGRRRDVFQYWNAGVCGNQGWLRLDYFDKSVVF
jgi:hypothetical protein